eukprot:c21547_g1_i1.p1 GENE.c21547_g1_i1~~c21547_g1_i1.p1  ORF type:complete len:1027 (+),score=287.03 c21547_g1_i1:319-3399(+)
MSTNQDLRNYTIRVQFCLAEGPTSEKNFFISESYIDLKEWIYDKLKEAGHNVGDISQYSVKCCNQLIGYEGSDVFNEEKPLQDIDCLRFCMIHNIIPQLKLIQPNNKKRAQSVRCNSMKEQIEFTTGRPIYETQDDDTSDFREEIGKEIEKLREDRKKRSETDNSREKLQDFYPSPSITHQPTYGREIFVQISFSENGTNSKFKFSDESTADEVIQTAYIKFCKSGLIDRNKREWRNFCLKTESLQECMLGDYQILSFGPVMSQYIKNEIKLEFCDIDKLLKEAENLEDDTDDLQVPPRNKKSDVHKITVDERFVSSLKLPFTINRPQLDDQSKEVCIQYWKKSLEIQQLPNFLWIEFSLNFGGKSLSKQTTQRIVFNEYFSWEEKIEFDFQLCNIPLGAELCAYLFGETADNKSFMFAKTSFPLADYDDNFYQGMLSRRMYPPSDDQFSFSLNKLLQPNLSIEFDCYDFMIKYDTVDQKLFKGYELQKQNPQSVEVPGPEEQTQLHECIERYHPLTNLNDSEKQLFWKYRYYLMRNKKAFPQFLQSVNWACFEDVCRAYTIIGQWEKVDPYEALELFSVRFSDPEVRKYAVERLHQLDDSEIVALLPQLVQVLKLEPRLNSALAKFLVCRALQNPYQVGHTLFWLLRGQLFIVETCHRFVVYLEEFLKGISGYYRLILIQECQLLDSLTRVCEHGKTLSRGDREAGVKKKLKELKFPTQFHIPLGFRWCASGINIDKCKIMDSAKTPLWLSLNSVYPNEPSFNVMFKTGDDLRQDVITLQMIKIMEKIWDQHGLEICLHIYNVVSTGFGTGFLEIVPDSVTYSQITREAGGAFYVLDNYRVKNWIEKQNAGNVETAVQNFIKSTAGYIVATYILGIGDRHDSNIMFTKKAHLFHIDFGHFLGHFKTAKAVGIEIQREKTPFVFTKDWAVAMGGLDSQNFKKFVDLCCEAFLCIRKKANLFINLFAMMLSTGIPELQSEDDIQYMIRMFMLDKSNDEAIKQFTDMIYQAHNDSFKRLDSFFHHVAH